MTPPPSARPAPLPGPLLARWVVRASEVLLRIEQHVVTALMALLLALILLNVGSRYAGHSIFWIDEAAVFSVVLLTFVGASAMTRWRLDFAVAVLTEHLSERGMRVARAAATALSLLFGIGLVLMCWWWLDPVGIAAAGFDAKAFAGNSFNFIYTERSQALGWPNWVFYLVVPLFACTSVLHTAANMVEDLGWMPPPQRRLSDSADAVGGAAVLGAEG